MSRREPCLVIYSNRGFHQNEMYVSLFTPLPRTRLESLPSNIRFCLSLFFHKRRFYNFICVGNLHRRGSWKPPAFGRQNFPADFRRFLVVYFVYWRGRTLGVSRIQGCMNWESTFVPRFQLYVCIRHVEGDVWSPRAVSKFSSFSGCDWLNEQKIFIPRYVSRKCHYILKMDAVSNHVVLYRTIWYHLVPYCTRQYHFLSWCTTRHHMIKYGTIFARCTIWHMEWYHFVPYVWYYGVSGIRYLIPHIPYGTCWCPMAGGALLYRMLLQL